MSAGHCTLLSTYDQILDVSMFTVIYAMDFFNSHNISDIVKITTAALD